jgi:long-chain fatty acid transport protein
MKNTRASLSIRTNRKIGCFATLLGATAVLVLAWIATPAARAGGILFYEFGTPDVGLASAGFAARAEDASTLFKNPAGMSRLDSPQFQAGVQALYGYVSLSPDANTSPRLGTIDGGNAVGWVPDASLFVTVPLGQRWRVGLGALSYFGTAVDYGDDWVGRYFVQKSTLLGVTLMPSVSFQVTDWLSIGAGLNAMYGYADTDVAVNNIVGPDGQMRLNANTWGFGADVGVLIQMSEKTRFGITYLSPVRLPFKATPTFTGLGPVLATVLANPPELDLGITVPQSVMISGYHDLNAKWAVMADFGWQNWNQFHNLQVEFSSGLTTSVIQPEFRDTWHGALGGQYRASEKWLFSGGVAFDSSAATSENRTFTLPIGQAWRFGLGVRYQLSHAINIAAGETFAWVGDMSINQGSARSLQGHVSGVFENAWVSFTSLSLSWSF